MEVRLLLILVTIFLARGMLPAQNLVPNPSFECGSYHCGPNTYSPYFSAYACNWSCPNRGTSDILSTVMENKECWASMPVYEFDYSFYIGNQLPRTGNRFAGIHTHGTFLGDSSYREYLQVQLTEPLVPGDVYCAGMYVSRAESPYLAANNLGMYFNPSRIRSGSFAELGFPPDILEEQVILDTAGWVNIYGLFTARDTSSYLIIGNFYDNSETISLPVGINYKTRWDQAYYFIDDVMVEKAPYDAFTFSGKTIVCRGDSVIIHANAGIKNIRWTTLSDTATVIGRSSRLSHLPPATTSYRVIAEGCGKLLIDTVAVTIIPLPEVDLGSDTTICAGTAIELDAGEHQKYSWQDNSTGRKLWVSDPGQYSVDAEDQYGCRSHAEITVSIKDLPVADLGMDTLICYNLHFPLKTEDSFEHYEWSTGSTDPVIIPTTAGQYWLRVLDQCGEAVDTINIHTLEDLFIPNVLTLNDDNMNRHLEVTGTGAGQYGRMSLFNRWGQEIYSDESYRNDWPENPDDVPSGTYYYTYEYPGCPVRKGWVKVIR